MNLIKSLGLSIFRKRCSIGLPRNPDNAVKSRRPGLKLPKIAEMIAVTLPVTNRDLIHHYPPIQIEINIVGLMDVGR